MTIITFLETVLVKKSCRLLLQLSYHDDMCVAVVRSLPFSDDITAAAISPYAICVVDFSVLSSGVVFPAFSAILQAAVCYLTLIMHVPTDLQ